MSWTKEDWKAWRKRNELTHAEAGEIVGKSSRQVKYYEAGRQSRGNGKVVKVAIPDDAMISALYFENVIHNDGRAVKSINAGGIEYNIQKMPLDLIVFECNGVKFIAR